MQGSVGSVLLSAAAARHGAGDALASDAPLGAAERSASGAMHQKGGTLRNASE